MKNWYCLICVLLIGCDEPPTVFDEPSKAEETISITGVSKPLGEVLDAYKGEVVLLDIWASWCGDCIVGFPKLREFQKKYPEVQYVFLSVDRSEKAWRNALNKYKLQGDHYFMPEGQKGALNDFLNSNWIPRYLIINKDGSIATYKAKRITDPTIEKTLKTVIN